jgi:two-component system chemotaxis response regulator CheY
MQPQDIERPHAPYEIQRRHTPRVLVVEDDVRIRDLIADELIYSGYQVELARNGAEALELVRTDRPDVIVLDLMMPVMDGWGFIERYRGLTHGEPIPIVVVSAAGAIPRSAYDMGVRRFLPKPFMPHELTEALDEVNAQMSHAL